MLKRNIGGLYTKAAVKSFEPCIDSCIDLFLTQLATRTEKQPFKLDMSLWLHLFSFDCLGEINISRKLGFLEQGKDVGSVIKSADQIFYLVGLVRAPLPRIILKLTAS